MIILGNLVAESYGLKTQSNVMDVIVTKDEEQKVKDKLRIFNNAPDLTTKYGKIYSTKNAKFRLFDVGRLPILNEIYTSSFSRKEITFAPPLYMYAWASNKARTLHKDLDMAEWEKSVAVYNYLRANYFGFHIVPDYQIKIDRIKLDMAVMNFDNPEYKLSSYEYRPFDTYKRSDLFQLYASDEDGYSLYEELLIAPKANFKHMRDMCSYMKWNKFTYEQKINAMIERIYVDICNEFLIEEIVQGWSNKTFSFSLSEMVLLALMYIISDVNHRWMAKFTLDNYNAIMAKIDVEELDLIYEAVQNNYLKEIK